MPIFEYRCIECNQTYEILQKNFTPFSKCSEINSECNKNSTIEKLVSGFSFSGFANISSQSQEPISNVSTAKTGCGCHGTTSCPGSDIRSKYGLT